MIRRVLIVAAALALIAGACTGASPTASPVGSAAATSSTSATPTAGAAASATAGPTTILRAQGPGYILLEHFGNAADGTKLADKDRRHLWLVRSDGTDLHELAPDQPVVGGKVLDKGPADWSPDGRHIVFGTSTDAGLVFETDADGSTFRLLSTECTGSPPTCLEFFPSYSPDGKRVVFVRLTDVPESGVIGIRDLASGKATLLESTRQGPPNLELGAPSWSPDGRQLVYFQLPKDSEGRPLGSSELYVVNADGTGRHVIRTPGLAAGDPRWSPDGSTIVFSTQPIRQWNEVGVEDHPDLYIIHPDGTGLKRLTDDGSSGAPSWTTDGKILYYSVAALRLMDADGQNHLLVGPGTMDITTEDTGYTYYARWQPVP